jgi:Pyruvate/2-oxoacid:ferredoxin oxidoreductase gamma subunit
VAFNAPSLTRFAPEVVPGGVVIYDSSIIGSPPPVQPTVRLVGVPCANIALELGKPVVKNVVALGALLGATRLFPEATFVTAIQQALHARPALIPLNEQALRRGREAAEAVVAAAVPVDA